MNFLNKNPLARLTFFITYLVISVWIVFDDFAWLNILFTLPVLLCCYITLVKSGVLKDKKADSIDNYGFDVVSIIATIVIVFVMLRKLH